MRFVQYTPPQNPRNPVPTTSPKSRYDNAFGFDRRCTDTATDEDCRSVGSSRSSTTASVSSKSSSSVSSASSSSSLRSAFSHWHLKEERNDAGVDVDKLYDTLTQQLYELGPSEQARKSSLTPEERARIRNLYIRHGFSQRRLVAIATNFLDRPVSRSMIATALKDTSRKTCVLDNYNVHVIDHS